MEYTSKSGKKRTLFDVRQDGTNVAPKWVAPENEQEPNESGRLASRIYACTRVFSVADILSFLSRRCRLWADLTDAIHDKNMEKATEAKSAVEDAQREDRRKREEKGEKHVPRFFELRNGQWLPKFTYAACSLLSSLTCKAPLTPIPQRAGRSG